MIAKFYSANFLQGVVKIDQGGPCVEYAENSNTLALSVGSQNRLNSQPTTQQQRAYRPLPFFTHHELAGIFIPE